MPLQTRIGTWYNWPFGAEETAHVDLQTEQNQSLGFYSENHRRQGSGWDGGGEFLSIREFTRYTPSGNLDIRVSNLPMYRGAVYATPPSVLHFVPPKFGDDIASFGPELYNHAKPAPPLMGGLNALYELKDLPGMVKQAFEHVRPFVDWAEHVPSKYWSDVRNGVSLSSVSDFNLAVAFGWLPLLGDVHSMYETQRKMASAVEQLLRDNGRPVRRTFTSEKHSSSSESVLAQGFQPHAGDTLNPIFITQAYGGGNWELSQHETVRTWFSGKFRYWLPEKGQMSNDEWTASLRSRLMGSRVTPSTIYKAIPWSWLIDWFGNVGDNIANLDTNVADRLINDYAFVMRHRESFNRMSVTHRFRGMDGRFSEARAVTESGWVHKARTPASPFGFGIKIPDLSSFQLTILGSLKGSRTRFAG